MYIDDILKKNTKKTMYLYIIDTLQYGTTIFVITDDDEHWNK